MGTSHSFAEKIARGQVTVGIIGLGYVGLPTAIGFHDAGFEIWGVDVSQRTVDMVEQEKTPLAIQMWMILFLPLARTLEHHYLHCRGCTSLRRCPCDRSNTNHPRPQARFVVC
jgi:hypothetical protein